MFEFFYKRPLLLGVILVIGSLFGVIGYLNMPRNLYPDLDPPSVTVITQLPGASALTVAQRVSHPIEQQLYTLSGVRDVRSINKNEVSIVTADFEYTKSLDRALLDVSNALAQARAAMPPEASPSSEYAVGVFINPVLTLALTAKPGSGLTPEQVRLLAENDIRTAFLTQPNIANVEIFGGHQPAVRVDIDPLKLARYHIDPAILQELIARIDRDYPVGIEQGNGAFHTLTVYGERVSVDALRALPLTGGLILGDVATVSLTSAERFSAFHSKAGAAIAVAIQRAPSGSVLTALDAAQRVLPSLEARFPNIQFRVVDSQGPLIRTSNSNMLDTLRDAVVFVALVMLLFLANWRAVVTALISIPLVFLLTLAVLWFTGKELNIVVMTGIILALGMLVDDAVVVLENIERHLEELHEEVQTAIRAGTQEVLFPVFIGTLATAVVIAPLMFVGGFPQQLFSYLVYPVLIAVFVSYFLAFTLIPRISLFWYRKGLPPKARWEQAIERGYQRFIGPGAALYIGLLRFVFNGRTVRRVIFLLLALALLVFSARTVLPLIGREAMPPMDTGIVRVHVKFGGNVTVREAEVRLAAFEHGLDQDSRLIRWDAAYGSEPSVLSLGMGQLPAEASYTLTYIDRLYRKETSWQIEADLRKQIAGIPGVVANDAYDFGATVLSSVKAPVDIRLIADDWRLLPAAADKARAAMLTVPGLTSVSTTWDRDSEEDVLVFNDAKLRKLGLTPEQITAQLPLKGLPVAAVSRLPSMSSIPVLLYFDRPYRSNPQALMNLPIRLPDGRDTTLAEVAHLVLQPSTAVLTTNGIRYSLDLYGFRNTVPVSFLSAGTMAAVEKTLPPGVSAEDYGDFPVGQESSRLMMLGLGLGMMLLFSVLVPAYRSVGLAALSVLILPLSAIGAIWGLLAFGKAMALPAILGIVLLFSIIIKNSILMVDFIQERRSEGQDAYTAAEGSIRLRYRPILMTAMATIAGMAPIAMQRAVGLERLSPLADAAIGGLLIGTFLTLFYLPMLYVWVSGKKKPATDDTGSRPNFK
ncbi:MAG: efflux RND transporter permease subunit [Sulfuriferula sp.]